MTDRKPNETDDAYIARMEAEGEVIFPSYWTPRQKAEALLGSPDAVASRDHALAQAAVQAGADYAVDVLTKANMLHAPTPTSGEAIPVRIVGQPAMRKVINRDKQGNSIGMDSFPIEDAS